MGLQDIFNRFRHPQATKSSAAGPMIAWSQVGQPRWTPRSYQNLAEEGFRKNVIAYRCVMQIATAGAAIPWLIYDDEGHEVDQHPLLDLLNHPNPLQDGVNFMENIYANLEIAGNAYVEAVQPHDGGSPVELYALRPDRMKIIPGPHGFPQGYQYSVGGQVTTWPADPVTGASNILHLKRFHPLDDWYGLAPMEAAAVSIDQHNAAGSWNQALLNQGARPSGALVFAPKDGPATLTDDQVNRLREELGQLYQGSKNAGRPLILEGGLDWREMSLSPKDMDWLAGRNAASRDIALAFGVPAQLVGVPDAQTYSNFAEARMAFYEETIIPLVTRVIAGFDHWLTPMFDDGLELDFDPDQISALSAKRDAMWNKLQNANFLTLNEKREAAGYGPLENGDRIKNSASARHRKDDEDDLGDDSADDTSSEDGGAQGGATGSWDSGATGTWADPSDQPQSPRNLSVSDDGVDFIADYEQFRSHQYDDQAGYPTIGYGHRLEDGESYPNGITEEEALNLLRDDIGSAEAAVRDNVNVNLTQDQFDALTSFIYNAGAYSFSNSTLLDRLNAGDYQGAADQFPAWNRITDPSTGDHVVSQGLVNRRANERSLFLSEDEDGEE